MEQVPLGAGISIFVCGLFLGFLFGFLCNRTSKPTLFIHDASLHNFTPPAQQVIALARTEADRFHHNFLGTEHLLLGLIKLDQGVAVNVLKKIGINLGTARGEIERLVGIGPDQKIIANIPYTPRTKKERYCSPPTKPKRSVTPTSAPNTFYWDYCAKAMESPRMCSRT